ncbi:protein artemis-like isoform X2 [Physella acuta]|uniref:protein artemis-like isoform X2 n=1 Tax=Physella acuta TaxID=109671 RepID=UPI0027DE7340|nr:protein artemis-like isoform X2 [Physella acuta]
MNDIKLYCSEITCMLLLAESEYKGLKDFIHILEVGVKHQIKIPGRSGDKDEEHNVDVTLISAGHCPGSVMFLFEGNEGTSLYTGDFRWEIGQAAKMDSFKCGNNIKEINTVYVDTTFCVPEAYHIPSRSECLEATVKLASDWLQHSHLHVVNISCPAKYGHEYLLMELAQRIDTKIHVSKWKLSIYDQIPELKGFFSSDPTVTRIHACSSKSGFPSSTSLPCHHLPSDGGKFKVLNIRPSTMWFTSHNTKSRTEDLIVTPASSRGLHRVCYSMHSSYSEIRDLVSYLLPKCAVPNVLPMSETSFHSVQARLTSFLDYQNKWRVKSETADYNKPLGTLRKLPLNRVNSAKENLNSDELVFSSPEKEAQTNNKSRLNTPVVLEESLGNTVSCAKETGNDQELCSDDLIDNTSIGSEGENSMLCYISGDSEDEIKYESDDENLNMSTTQYNTEASSVKLQGLETDSHITMTSTNKKGVVGTHCRSFSTVPQQTEFELNNKSPKDCVHSALIISDKNDCDADEENEEDFIPNSQDSIKNNSWLFGKSKAVVKNIRFIKDNENIQDAETNSECSEHVSAKSTPCNEEVIIISSLSSNEDSDSHDSPILWRATIKSPNDITEAKKSNINIDRPDESSFYVSSKISNQQFKKRKISDELFVSSSATNDTSNMK